VYFLNWNLILLLVIVILPFIFADDAIILSYKLWKTLHFRSEHLYFPLWIPVFLALIFLYFPRDGFIIFLAILRGICTSKTEHLYFVESVSVLPSTWFYHFSSTSCESCTSETEHFCTFLYYCIYFLLT
jgi:hypothetical protein